MKLLIKTSVAETEDIFCMSKLTEKKAKEDVKPLIPGFIYFSAVLSGHGPRVKFNGGTSYTDTTQTTPSMKFDKEGSCELELQPWMNKKNCPNAYDEVISNVASFVYKYLPLLFLTWFKKLDETDGLYEF